MLSLCLFQESGSNANVSRGSSETCVSENAEKDTNVTSAAEKEYNMTVDHEKGRLTLDEGETEESKPDSKNSDVSIEEASKANDDTHSDPEAGESEESSLSPTKEPSIDAVDNKEVPPVDNISETDSNLEVCPLKMRFPILRSSSTFCHSQLVLGHIVCVQKQHASIPVDPQQGLVVKVPGKKLYCVVQGN